MLDFLSSLWDDKARKIVTSASQKFRAQEGDQVKKGKEIRAAALSNAPLKKLKPEKHGALVYH